MELFLKLIFGLAGKAIEAHEKSLKGVETVTYISVLEIDAAIGFSIGLGVGEQVVLREGYKEDTIVVLARGTSLQYIELGTVLDARLYEKVVAKRARGKITEVDKGLVTITFDW
jgi:hypothetical protein